MLRPGRSAHVGVSAADLSGATGVEQVWCAGPRCRERDSGCLGGCAWLTGACGTILLQVTFSQSAACPDACPALSPACWCNWIGGHSSSHLLSALARGDSGPVLQPHTPPPFYFGQRCPETPGQRWKRQYGWGQTGLRGRQVIEMALCPQGAGEDKAQPLPATKPQVSIPFLPMGSVCMVGRGAASY